jgi:hypothetical protein
MIHTRIDLRTLDAWRYLAPARGPIWILRLLARDGVEGPVIYENFGPFKSEQFDPNFFWLHAMGEIRQRGLQGVPAGFTGKKRRHMVEELMRRGIDGNDGSIFGSSSNETEDETEE